MLTVHLASASFTSHSVAQILCPEPLTISNRCPVSFLQDSLYEIAMSKAIYDGE